MGVELRLSIKTSPEEQSPGLVFCVNAQNQCLANTTAGHLDILPVNSAECPVANRPMQWLLAALPIFFARPNSAHVSTLRAVFHNRSSLTVIRHFEEPVAEFLLAPVYAAAQLKQVDTLTCLHLINLDRVCRL